MQSSDIERQKNLTLETLNANIADLGKTFTSLFNVYWEKQKEIIRQEQLEHYRQMDRLERIFTLKNPSHFLFLDVIATLKSLEALVPACETVMRDINIFLEDDAISAEDKEILREKFYAFDEVQQDVEDCIGIYTQYYDGEDDEFRKEIHDVFSDHPDLVQWFTGHLIAARKSQEEQDDIPPPQQLYREAHGRLIQLIPQLNEWLTLIELFNKDMSTERTYPESVEKYAQYCCDFMRMKDFCKELSSALELMCDYLAAHRMTLEPITRESLLDLLCELSANNAELVENIIELRKLMNVLATGYKQNQAHLSPLLCKFMSPWLTPHHPDPLAESVAIWKANQESTKNSDNESPRPSFFSK